MTPRCPLPPSWLPPLCVLHQPPQGVEEGRWLALRKVCLYLAGAKPNVLCRSSYRHGAGGGGGVDGVDGSSGADLMGALQEALVRSLCGSRPEAQVWVGLVLIRRFQSDSAVVQFPLVRKKASCISWQQREGEVFQFFRKVPTLGDQATLRFTHCTTDCYLRPSAQHHKVRLGPTSGFI